jgi:endonuclease-8
MPEGDTIWRTAAALRRRIEGKVVIEARPDRIRRLQGRHVLGVEPTGKHLIMRFDGNLALHSHMRMTGAWHLYRPGERWRQPAHRVRALLAFDDVVAVCFAAPVVELVADPRRPVAHLGPDILVEPFDLDAVIRRARQSTNATLGELLLDQRVSAGIGNIYKCESLWAQRLDPFASPATLDDPTLARLYLTARNLMRQSLAGRGFNDRRAVHARGGRPCPRCAMPIQIRAQGEQARLTYFCPRCQAAASRNAPPGR